MSCMSKLTYVITQVRVLGLYSVHTGSIPKKETGLRESEREADSGSRSRIMRSISALFNFICQSNIADPNLQSLALIQPSLFQTYFPNNNSSECICQNYCQPCKCQEVLQCFVYLYYGLDLINRNKSKTRGGEPTDVSRSGGSARLTG